MGGFTVTSCGAWISGTRYPYGFEHTALTYLERQRTLKVGETLT